MSDPAADDSLLTEVNRFAEELHTLLAAVLRSSVAPFTVSVATTGQPHVAIRQAPPEGIPLAVDGETVLLLKVSFRCTWDSASQYLAVRWSRFEVGVPSVDEPLFRYDYDAGCDGNIPAAHLNVHSHRDELVFAMLAAGARLRGRSRRTSLRRGEIPRLSTLHFPLGGHRFRPALEDVLEMLVREFGLDVNEQQWMTAIGEGRERWRAKQLGAAIRDDPATAAAVLASLQERVEESARHERVRAF